MKIENDKLQGQLNGHRVKYKETPNHSGPFNAGSPDTIIVHYTAGGSLNGSVNWLCNPQAKASAHLVVGKDGEIVQLAPFNRITWHAGRSRWKSRSGLNRFSIGIEIDNAGILEKRVGGFFTYFGKEIDQSSVVIAQHKNRDKEMAWEAYTPEQIEAVESICLLLKQHYPISEILGHDDIAPDRKTDPGPAFPMQRLQDRILYGRRDDEDEPEEETERFRAVVIANSLNIRDRPRIDAPKVTDPLPKGTVVEVLDSANGWSQVEIKTRGWVSSRYLKG